MKNLLTLLFLSAIGFACGQTHSQNSKAEIPKAKKEILGQCEGCEAIYEAKGEIKSLVYLPDYQENTGKKLKVFGKVFKIDGKTPAANVIIYLYHTDQKGLYSQKGNESGWAKRHGYIRGWVKTNEKGDYQVFTQKPASYPKSRIPAHIHTFIKEPDKGAYYIDDIVFADDPFLDTEYKQNEEKRGGSGIVQTIENQEYIEVKRDIILGLNVPQYPAPAGSGAKSLRKTTADVAELKLNSQKSVVKWYGSKFAGLGKHEGIVKIKSGGFQVSDNQLVGGEFVIDMTTISVTDIPESDPIPRKKLREHLMNQDFFWVEKYPTAHFKIQSVAKQANNFHLIKGIMTIRGVSKTIEFHTQFKNLSSQYLKGHAKLSFNRQDFGIAFRGSKLTNDLVDDTIILNIDFESK
jgi:protocatechuate 3,4-dioxygenase beta subunit